MSQAEQFQRIADFRMPEGFRGRPAWFVQIWWVVQATAFRFSPRMANGFRCWLLRLFGAHVGARVLIRPSATFTYPWKVSIGDDCWIGDQVVFYSLGRIDVGSNSVVSQLSYLCAGDHDHQRVDFPIRARDIVIGNEVWVAADVFVGPGVTIGDAAVVGSRSSVFRSLPSAMVCAGNPCVPLHARRRATAKPQPVVRGVATV